MAAGINDRGQIVSTTSVQNVGALGIGLAASNIAFGINNAGDVEGTYNEGDAIGAYVSSSGGIVTRFDRLSSPEFWRVYGINDAGQLVGSGVGGAVLATPNGKATPEPASLMLMAFGLAGVGLLIRCRR